ncbi:MAG: DUF3109 family protein [Prevotella sp.]|nr:DUF3109 family protein [Prevotella sp.]
MVEIPPIIQVGDVLLSSDILMEKFCCDLSACKGQCCVEGDAGAPVTLEEIAEIEDCLDEVWGDLSASAQAVIDKQGVAYTDKEGDLVTSIVRGKDCVFTYYDSLQFTVDGLQMNTEAAEKSTVNCKPSTVNIDNCCLCALEKAFRAGKTRFCKPVSCALYPIREKRLGNDLIGLNYNRWEVCKMAVAKGRQKNIPLYQFLREPLIRRFGEDWYQELLDVTKFLLASSDQP